MTNQEAYNAGLNSAENEVIRVFLDILTNPKSEEKFLNPNMEIIREVIKRRSDYHWGISTRINNTGKAFKAKLEKDQEELDKLEL